MAGRQSTASATVPGACPACSIRAAPGKLPTCGADAALSASPALMPLLRRTLLVLLGLLASSPVQAAELPWPDTPVGRLEALAVLQGFNADLLSHPSATLTLERWCAAHRLAAEGSIVADLDRAADKPASADQRARLGVDAGEPVAYRRVRLSCGGRVLSEADNWYVPSRLTPEMNRLLTETTMPFGRAVLDLGFHRDLLSAELLWQPLPLGWEVQAALPPAGAGPLAIPDHVLQHRAVLLTHDNVPFSEVVETYTAEVLGFAPPEPQAAPADDGLSAIPALWRLQPVSILHPFKMRPAPALQKGPRCLGVHRPSLGCRPWAAAASASKPFL